jgi:hypothetical protein
MRRPGSACGRRRTAAGNGIRSGRQSTSCLGSSCSWGRTHPRLRSPCGSDSCQRASCWDCLRQAWRRSWAWIGGPSAIGSGACGFLPRRGSQRSRHSCRQVAGSRLESQLLQAVTAAAGHSRMPGASRPRPTGGPAAPRRCRGRLGSGFRSGRPIPVAKRSLAKRMARATRPGARWPRDGAVRPAATAEPPSAAAPRLNPPPTVQSATYARET